RTGELHAPPGHAGPRPVHQLHVEGGGAVHLGGGWRLQDRQLEAAIAAGADRILAVGQAVVVLVARRGAILVAGAAGLVEGAVRLAGQKAAAVVLVEQAGIAVQVLAVAGLGILAQAVAAEGAVAAGGAGRVGAVRQIVAVVVDAVVAD